MIDIQMPSFNNGSTTDEKLLYTQKYLYELAQKLDFELKNLNEKIEKSEKENK